MAINQERIQDAYQAIAFADDMRAIYNQAKVMQAKIARYGAAVAAVAAGTAAARETIFADLVEDVIDAGDIARLAAFAPTLSSLIALLEADYDDFINPQ